MNPVTTVFRKELIDVLRDRRTLVFMLVLPTLAIPAIMWVTTELMTHFIDKLAKERVDILVINPQVAPEVKEELAARADPRGRALELVEVLQRQGLSEKELARTKGEPRRFSKLLEEKGIEKEKLFKEIRSVVGEDEFDAEPRGILAQAYPPNFRIITPEDLKVSPEVLADPAKKAEFLTEAIRSGKIAAAVEFQEATARRLREYSTAGIGIYYLQSVDRSEAARNGLSKVFNGMGRKLVARRVRDKELPAGFARPYKLDVKKLPGPGPLVKLLSQMLPYMILIFAFLGAVYPAIDLGAGEKERGTLETLLVAPVSRLSLVLGKFLVVLCAALISALLATASLAFSLNIGVFSELAELGGSSFSLGVIEIIAVLSMIIPVGAIFSALLLAISIFAKSFKEGQSYAAPLQFLIIMPAFVSFVPGVKLDWAMASIPVVNISLALKEIFTGNLDRHWHHVGLIFVSTTLVASLLLLFATRWFQREEVLFRS